MVAAVTLMQMLDQCSKLIQQNKHAQLEGLGHIHRGQGRLLGILYQKDGIAQKEIVHLMQIRPASVGELVGKLEQNGYVRRFFSSDDKRVSKIYLTKKGRQSAKQIVMDVDSVIQELFSGLLPNEQEQLYHLLQKLNDSIQRSTYPQREQGQACPHNKNEVDNYE